MMNILMSFSHVHRRIREDEELQKRLEELEARKKKEVEAQKLKEAQRLVS